MLPNLVRSWLLLAGSLLPAALQAHWPMAGHDQACELISNRLGSVDLEDCRSAGLEVVAGSVNGLPILAGDYLPNQPSAAEPYRVMLVGGIHGDELSSVSVVFRWLRRLRQDPYRQFHWRIVPVLNPDGLLKRPASRTNANGVDLNRNFPTPEGQAQPLDYWIERTGRDRRRFPGPTPFSEPETRWLANEIDRFKPDALVQVHAPYGVLDYDGPPEPPDRIGYLHLKLLGAYPGSIGNYMGVARGHPVVTLELPHAGIMPTAQQQLRIWSDLSDWLATKLPPRTAPPYFLRLAEQPWLQARPRSSMAETQGLASLMQP